MISSRELFIHGNTLILRHDPGPVEADIRGAISSFYYGLFHWLTAAGSAVFQNGGAALEAQVSRAFSHAAMRRVCETYVRAGKRPLPPPLDRLAPSPCDPRLIEVADIFVKLQEVRHEADYGLSAEFSQTDGFVWQQQAGYARWKLEELQGSQDLTVFLAALLLGDRWTRRG